VPPQKNQTDPKFTILSVVRILLESRYELMYEVFILVSTPWKPEIEITEMQLSVQLRRIPVVAVTNYFMFSKIACVCFYQAQIFPFEICLRQQYKT
jgi:hypothetical protein